MVRNTISVIYTLIFESLTLVFNFIANGCKDYVEKSQYVEYFQIADKAGVFLFLKLRYKLDRRVIL